jgi:malonyl-CoA O-methyltransferase
MGPTIMISKASDAMASDASASATDKGGGDPVVGEPAGDIAYHASIAQAFGQAASTYNSVAIIQDRCAQMLLDFLDSNTRLSGIPTGPILEIGCGTGFLSQGLVERFGASHPLAITDLAPEMVAIAQTNLAALAALAAPTQPGRTLDLTYATLNAEYLAETCPDERDRYALIASNFALQWFQNPLDSLLSLLRCLQPGGWLALSFPSCHSFRQFRQICDQAQVPYPINPLPDPTPFLGVLWPIARDCMFQQDFLAMTYPSGRDFLRQFRAIGAHTNLSGVQLSPGQLRRLLQYWQAQSEPGTPIEVDYHAVFLLIQR